jgi:hypothetical protein
MPPQVLELMALYPQPVRDYPTVEPAGTACN